MDHNMKLDIPVGVKYEPSEIQDQLPSRKLQTQTKARTRTRRPRFDSQSPLASSSSSTLRRITRRTAATAALKTTSRLSQVVESFTRNQSMSTVVAASTGGAPSLVEEQGSVGRRLKGMRRVLLENEGKQNWAKSKREKEKGRIGGTFFFPFLSLEFTAQCVWFTLFLS
ncbi:hypothetical protein K435DRAFT_220694 [Dendrothele bispora CBS 962.96]|uniref:Uncharacterized protein n=1 Tax=Dendrothele bispora (strain CBS 962.96) TaxID=1314807 RepID=A0A4S8MMY6_DENBC|nr:hypothetical protein K435DRAFT_220694 [Dendrothele bispora CBS 962.96]